MTALLCTLLYYTQEPVCKLPILLIVFFFSLFLGSDIYCVYYSIFSLYDIKSSRAAQSVPYADVWTHLGRLQQTAADVILSYIIENIFFI